MRKTLSLFVGAVCLFVSTPSGKAQSTTLDAEQSAFLTLINNYRAQNGAGPLQVSVTLQQSSQWMSADMAAKNYFSHTDSLGRNPFTRMAAFGYPYSPAGENIAAGYSDAQSTFTQWQNACDADASGNCTYAHRYNMLYSSYKVIGIGRAYNAASTYRYYWTTDFGAVVDQTLAQAPAIGSFTATPLTISAGQPVTLAWSVSGATTISIDNGIGYVTGLTSKIVAPVVTTQYTLTATNANGSRTASVSVTVGAPPPTGVSIWPTSSIPTMYLTASGPLEMGMKFRSDVAGKITGIRFYKIPANTGIHTGSLWSADGRLLATGTFTNETASGWQTLQFASPVAISAKATYVTSYHTNSGVAAVGFELQARSQDSPPLHGLQTGLDGYNGIYVFSAGGTFPVQGTSGYNFWVDVVFTP